MSVAAVNDLLSLARSRTPADRERLLLGMAELCEAPGAQSAMNSGPVREVLGSIFLGLVAEAERDIRKRLAEKLASAAWPPVALVNILALDDIEIAQPIIAASPVLQDADLIRLLIEATVEHQIEVARRPKLGPAVVQTILQQGEPAVLTALAGNLSTELSEKAMADLVAAAHRVAGLRAPLARHPQLTEALARQLYIWVGQSLRQALLGRFAFDPQGLDAALAEAVQEAHGGMAREPEETAGVADEAERQAMETRLIDKLAAAGQLRPGYLMRALREHKLTLFAAALATLGRFKPEEIRRALASERPDLLALACAGVEIDRSVFPSLLEMVRKLNGGLPGGGAEGARRAAGAFGPFAPEIARAAFRQAVNAV